MAEITLMAKCGLLYPLVQKREGDLNALREQVGELFNIATQQDNSAQEKRLLAQMIVQLSPQALEKPFPFSDEPLQKCFGTVNQFSDDLQAESQGKEESSACTSCAQCFLTRALDWNGVMDVRPEDLDEIVRDGKMNYELMRERAWLEHKRNPAVPFYQCFSHIDTKDIYGLDHVNCETGQVLKRDDQNQSTKLFFQAELDKFEQLVMQQGNLGGILHSQGKTYALVVYHRGDHFEYVLFDSHGNQELNQNKAAYDWATKSREKMAEALSELIPFVPTLLPGIPPAQRQSMEVEDNGVILYIVKKQEISRYPRTESLGHEPQGPAAAGVGQSSTSSAQRATSPAVFPRKEPEDVRRQADGINRFAQMLFVAIVATLIAVFRNFLANAVTSYTGRGGQAVLIPPATSSVCTT